MIYLRTIISSHVEDVRRLRSGGAELHMLAVALELLAADLEFSWGVGWVFYCIFCFILVLSGWESFIGLIVITAVGAFARGLLACKYGPEIVLIGTSFIGSYIFMRGWTYILGGFQSEAEIVSKVANHEILEVPVSYWWYMILFVVVFLFTSQWQRMKEEDAEELTVNQMTNYIMGVFKDNPWMLDFLKQNLDKSEESI